MSTLTETFQKVTCTIADLLRGKKTVLRNAIEHNDWETATKILAENKDARNWTYPTINGAEKPLHLAARCGAMEILNFMTHSSFGRIDIDEPTSSGLTPLMIALAQGRDGAAKLFLDKGADIHARGGRGGGVLCCAVNGGSTAMVDLLLSKGLVLNETDPEKGSPLMVAAYHASSIGMLKHLLDKGADPNVRGGGLEALRQALNEPNIDGFRVLLARGANIDLADEKGCAAVLSWAVCCDFPEIVDTLLNRGINPDLRDNSGATCAELAALRAPKSFEVIHTHIARRNKEARDELIASEVGVLHAGLPNEVKVKPLRLRRSTSP